MADTALVALISALVLAGAIALIAIALRWRRKRRRARGNPDPAGDYAPRAHWAPTSGKLNFSSFVYMDVDGDGAYGQADRPMAGIVVRLYDERGTFLASARSNAAGFANFPMSSKRRSAAIQRPGVYRFSVSVPPGWRASSANQDQTVRLRDAPGAMVGLIGEALPKPVGLAPGRTLNGRTPAATGVTLSVMAKGQLLESRALPADAAFRFPLGVEADEIVIAGSGLDRRLKLSGYPVDLGLLVSGALSPGAALRAIGFDDITPRGLCKVPSGHAGLDWRNLNAMARDHTANSEGYVNGNVSGAYIAYTSSGHPAEFGRDAPFGFHSVMLTAAWLASEGETARVESWLGEELIASDEIALSALAPVQYAPMLQAVTRVRISTRHHWQAVLDDLIVAL
ncbi:hypothetical protein LB534_18105 [Mesorhizobium sp. CA18]|uniref:hypothetical protein n=1 Tax=unclassified Mesorhizobium TaxID=325217 RepID=UPI001CCAF4E0|nr:MULTISPECIES: hypothetical protein [unclassified Mesorhizobium]MBZ9736585.1 hypothetical protein [Mesorhizobium sp. CA9]MBZ9827201.1 hypothetical protein [Mesorhizobium sp. CA18]MBZ9832774.1 hypothetical protein [Mesorhizobium sp. CA2]MBZ9839051.1 hypothetical protein [Mesorhizobium sp. CA3]MBZ9879504.1 hypothetical protein [Mesorhizobium sp. Ca11]